MSEERLSGYSTSKGADAMGKDRDPDLLFDPEEWQREREAARRAERKMTNQMVFPLGDPDRDEAPYIEQVVPSGAEPAGD